MPEAMTLRRFGFEAYALDPAMGHASFCKSCWKAAPTGRPGRCANPSHATR